MYNTGRTFQRGDGDGWLPEPQTPRELALHTTTLPGVDSGERRGRGSQESGVAAPPEGGPGEEVSQSAAREADSSEELSWREVEKDGLQQLRWQVQQLQHGTPQGSKVTRFI